MRWIPASIPTVTLTWAAFLAAGRLPVPAQEAAASAPAVEPGPITDAALRDVFFVDRLRGWVVGDAGVILRTEDAGDTWRRVPSGTTGSLERVYFHDRQHGWIVGGLCRRLRPGGYGVVLRTEDGGETWIKVPLPRAGWLRDVRFANKAQGWACGEATPDAPTGLIHTTNGGVTWSPVRGGETEGLFALALTEPPHGWAAGAVVPPRPIEDAWEGPPPATQPVRAPALTVRQVLGFRGGDLEPVPAPMSAPAAIRSMQFIDPRRGWMGGDAGTAYWTTNAGATWTRSEMPWTGPALAAFDLHRLFFATEARGWAVGRVGSVVLSTGNGGRAWSAVRIPERVPLHGLHFVNANRGYAVGDLGLILRTSDGGQTWRAVHRADSRASLLVVLVAPGGYPWTLLARYAGDEGYRTVVLDWTHLKEEPAVSRRAQALRRACQAVGVPACETLRAASQEDLCRELVRAIRTWLPAVVVVAVDPADAQRSRMCLEAARRAFRRAADGAQYPEQGAQYGLDVCQPKRLVECAPQPDSAPEDAGARRAAAGVAYVGGKEYSPRLNETYSILGLRAAEQLHQPATTVLAGDRLRVVEEVLPTPPGAAEHLFRGAYVPAGTAGRRTLGPVAPEREAHAERLSDAVRGLWFAFLLKRHERQLGAFISMAGDFARLHPETSEGAYALTVAAKTLEAEGELGLAYLALEGVRPAPGAPDAPGLPQALYAQATYLLEGLSDPRLARFLDPAAYEREGLVAQRRSENEAALRGSIERVQLLQTLYPSERGLPELDFRLAAAHRLVERPEEALRLCRDYAGWPPYSVWGRNARGELSLAAARLPPAAKPVLRARRARRPPVLDGRLADDVWPPVGQPVAPHTGGQPADLHETTVRFLHDEEALYVAVEGRPTGQPSREEAARWAALGYGYGDRIDLLLDVNRDYATHFRLSIELPGRKSEALGGGMTLLGGPPAERPWQAPWRARSSLLKDRFVAECAVDLRLLGVYQVEPRTVWGVNVAVTRQDGTAERLSGRAPVGETPSFGYLVFED